MLKKLKINKDLIFPVFGFLIIFVIIGFVVFSVNFLVDKINIALDIEGTNGQILSRINFEELKKIKIME
ncbi:hypothetical protein A2999_01875 [Candidatus Wolfebacteria bacterium RIFCSPLOWO2_01_FULL_38_11]|uniref:Uncharacterized protein n=2 Tax=Candidatus Wolfeibacteriota TaxID=1752735 RepID=A0A0G0FYX7_9BACT|nr:MAG: hypothetical protein US36_C0005G0003 [Candidatus Wolfebacteria bacterium GW2011_GWC1_37_10]OGM90690.1 MAG: hypothetical protein A2999_01875 [Candidatus Wolfebacteria bacterium RIFCSPLOWO2_01_FULL_38_11]